MSELVLSLFPGIDLLGRGFEAEGFAVVRGPDILWGGDIREFHVPVGRFDGVIGGSPCQDFSRARRAAPTGEGLQLLGEFVRVVAEAAPRWFLLENVPTVPDVVIPGYTIQRFDLNARECGMKQSRLRHFQFGSALGLVVSPERLAFHGAGEPICLASEFSRLGRRSWPDFCELQGLPRDFDLPGLGLAAKYKAVGNGVPVPMAKVLARAVAGAFALGSRRLCACGCGRVCQGQQVSASASCRKRLQRLRAAPGSWQRQIVTV